MGIRGLIAKPVTRRIEKQLRHWAARPLETQEAYFQLIRKHFSQSKYGKSLGVHSGMPLAEWREAVPLVDYEDLKPLVERMMAGEEDVCWPGKPKYLVMSSGTTSGKKYIPWTDLTIKGFKRGTTDAFCSYIARSGNFDIWDGKTLPLTGSPALTMMGEIPSARVSGLLNHFLQWYARWNRVPTWETNSIPDFERKVSAILDETLGADVRAVTGLPVWLNLLFKRMEERTGKKVGEIWPGLKVMVYGGLQVDPYKEGLLQAIGREIDFVEVFNASEGFFAFEDNFEGLGLLLHLHSGNFYEFMPADDFRAGKVRRLGLDEVELGVDYGIVLNTVSGVCGYDLGDTVRFTSRDPYRVVFTGRLAHFTSAFNEHIIQSEVEAALRAGIDACGGSVSEFTVAPQIHPAQGAPYHEWLVEFKERPADLEAFRLKVDETMRAGNHLYRELVAAGAMRSLHLSVLAEDAFLRYMEAQGTVGSQFKLPRLKNDRSIADAVASDIIETVVG